MSKTNDGGPAYPQYTGNPDHWVRGMSRRDYFAGQALAGLSVSPSMRQVWNPEDMARQSVQWADALIAELEKSAS